MRLEMRRATAIWGAVLVWTVAVVALAGTPRLARAHGGIGGDDETDECRPACGDAKKACKQAGKMALKSCVQSCRASRMPGSCFHDCRGGFATARKTCKEDVKQCKEACTPVGDGGPSQCERGCIRGARECLAGVGEDGKTCGLGCANTARRAFTECFEGEDILLCMLQTARELSQCLGGCAEGLQSGVEGCKETALECRERCGAYGSPSRAFLDLSQGLLD